MISTLDDIFMFLELIKILKDIIFNFDNIVNFWERFYDFIV